jgi:GNAT superfamily N-acetyltransferase
MDPFLVRRATVDDATGIAEIQVRTWRVAYRDLLPADYLGSLSVVPRERMWTQLLDPVRAPEHSAFVAVVDGRLVGFVSAGPAHDIDLGAGRWGEVYAIYVEPASWGEGVGRALLAAAVDHLQADGMDPLVLWVLEGNDRARAFYERAGWRLDGAARTEAFGGEEAGEVRYQLGRDGGLGGGRGGGSRDGEGRVSGASPLD